MWLMRSDEKTNENYGKAPEQRSIEELLETAVVVVDKHAGPTSHQITQWVKKIFNARKAGHAGTLDPQVTGVLPIALNDATKAMMALMGLSKEYVGVMYLHKEISKEALQAGMQKWVGEIVQVPPKRSAVARKPRKKKVYKFEIIEMEGRYVLFRVSCEAGVYIRKLVHDLGQNLGIGAHMTELRRTKVGNFNEEQAKPLLAIRDAYELWKKSKEEKYLREILIPVEYAVAHLKKVFVKDSAIAQICNGAPVYVNGLVRIQKEIKPGELVAVYSLKNELVALGIAKMTSKQMYERARGIAIRTDRVIMKKGVYPNFRKFKK